MCLNKVTSLGDETPSAVRVGYKYLHIGMDGDFYGPCMYNYIQGGVWNEAFVKDVYAEGTARIAYPSGFHIFTDEQQAKSSWLKWLSAKPVALFKVEYTDVSAVGLEDGDGMSTLRRPVDIVVAKYMRVVERVQ